ncbi:hypothetical protein E4U15_005536 [Claviceps sp. LM218 group G6]|nr:hypothetical protein E4U15_005536 [Claviceps sp. LM218 group G6]
MTSTGPLMITVPFPRNERVARKKEHFPRDPRMPFSNGTLLYKVPGRKLKVGEVLEGLGFIALYGIHVSHEGQGQHLFEWNSKQGRSEERRSKESTYIIAQDESAILPAAENATDSSIRLIQ